MKRHVALALTIIIFCLIFLLASARGSSGSSKGNVSSGSSPADSSSGSSLTGGSSSGSAPAASGDKTPAPQNPPKSDKPRGVNPNKSADPAPILITELDLEDLLSRGLPLVLNFGDNGVDSMSTLATLAIYHRDIGDLVLIRSVDLSKNPSAKDGFPAPIIPTQFFYNADGSPISLPVGIGVVLSSYNDLDTMETVFTAHEGPLSFNDLLKILIYMNVVSQ